MILREYEWSYYFMLIFLSLNDTSNSISPCFFFSDGFLQQKNIPMHGVQHKSWYFFPCPAKFGCSLHPLVPISILPQHPWKKRRNHPWFTHPLSTQVALIHGGIWRLCRFAKKSRKLTNIPWKSMVGSNGQIKILHQPRLPWNKSISRKLELPFGGPGRVKLQ